MTPSWPAANAEIVLEGGADRGVVDALRRLGDDLVASNPARLGSLASSSSWTSLVSLSGSVKSVV